MSIFSILEYVKGVIDEQPNPVQPYSINHEFTSKVASFLQKFEPFANLTTNHCLVDAAGGSVRWQPEFGAHWAIRQLIAGHNPAEIESVARRQIERNALEIIEVSELVGVKTDDIVEISKDTYLYPNDKLPFSIFNERVFFDRWASGSLYKTEKAALVRNITIDPVCFLCDDKSLEQVMESHVRASEDRSLYRRDIYRALVLQGSEKVDIGSTYCIPLEDNILFQQHILYGSLNSSGIVVNFTPNVADTISILDQILNFKDSGALKLAIDRLGRSRNDYDYVNKAIDIGMSLEIALMHNDSNAKDEITSKLKHRAGWLLGKKVDDRISIAGKIGKIYEERSSATHRGKLKNMKFDFADADAHMVRIFKELLRRGEFPDWNYITFGGEI